MLWKNGGKMDEEFTHRLKYALYGGDCECCTGLVDIDFIAETYCNNGTYRDRFYYLARLNEQHKNISREILLRKISILTKSYMDLFDPNLPFTTHNVHVCRFFFESATRIGEFRDTLMRYCENLTLTQDTINHLYDILPRCALKDTVSAHATINVRRRNQYGAEVETTPQYYENKQNVHLVDICTKDGCRMKDRSEDYDACVGNLPDEIRNMHAIEAIRISNAQMNLRSTFVNVVDVINKQQNEEIRVEMYKRLKEELVEMDGYCATGMNMRLINVLTGYTDELQIKISFEREMKATLFARFKIKLDEMSVAFKDMYYEGMLVSDKPPDYLQFRTNITSQLYPEIKSEYKSIPGFDEKVFDYVYEKACGEL